ncbi:MAG: hypothetical protein ACOH1I_09560 [Gallionellaceae bacterium]
MSHPLYVFFILYCFNASIAFAQVQFVTIRGVVQQFEPPMVTVKTSDNSTEQIRLSEKFQITTMAAAKITDIVRGKYLGITSSIQENGELTATEVRVFSKEMRGAGEGHLIVQEGVTITNATVTKVSTTKSGVIVTLRYGAAEKKITIPKKVPIVALGFGEKKLLQPGALVSISTIMRPDGIQTSNRVTLGLMGFMPQ